MKLSHQQESRNRFKQIMEEWVLYQVKVSFDCGTSNLKKQDMLWAKPKKVVNVWVNNDIVNILSQLFNDRQPHQYDKQHNKLKFCILYMHVFFKNCIRYLELFRHFSLLLLCVSIRFRFLWLFNVLWKFPYL